MADQSNGNAMDGIKFMNLLGNVTFSHRPLPAPDVMITVLYNINQKALLALVNPEVKNFIFKLVMSRNSGASYYLIRNGNDISIGTGPHPHDQYEIRYQAQDNGVWKMISASHYLGYYKGRGDKRSMYEEFIVEKSGERKKARECKKFDNMISQEMIQKKLWRALPEDLKKKGVVLDFKGSDDIGIDFGGYARLMEANDEFNGQTFVPHQRPQQVNASEAPVKSTPGSAPVLPAAAPASSAHDSSSRKRANFDDSAPSGQISKKQRLDNRETMDAESGNQIMQLNAKVDKLQKTVDQLVQFLANKS